MEFFELLRLMMYVFLWMKYSDCLKLLKNLYLLSYNDSEYNL